MKKPIKLICRALGAAFLLFIIFSLFGDGFPDIGQFSPTEKAMSIAMAGMVVGILLEYKWGLVGGILMFISYLFMVWVEGNIFVGYVFPVIGFIGLVHVGLYIWTQKPWTV